MAFRGYFALNGVEFANSSRVLEHIGKTTPTQDSWIGGSGDPCVPELDPTDDGLALLPATSAPLPSDPGLATPPDGSELYDPGLAVIDGCWVNSSLCGCTSLESTWDDTWPELKEFLQDTIYRVELAPWYTTAIPQSAEFGGVWVMDAKGFGPPVTDRQIAELVGSGGTASPHRYASKKLSFDALLLACTNAGLEFGVQWLQCQLAQTISEDGTLRYFAAHPNSAADPATLLRDLHGVVMTQSVTPTRGNVGGGKKHQQATMYRVTFELTAQDPFAYLPPIHLSLTWDEITTEGVSWVLAAKATPPSDCDPSPVLMSATAPPTVVDISTAHPPPVAGGGLSVCALDRYVFEVPLWQNPVFCQETVVSMTIRNNLTTPLTLQGWWKHCSDPEECDRDRWPIQLAGLPGLATIHLDGIRRSYTGEFGGREVRPMGIVGTPTGVPWRPPVLDRAECWQFVVLAPLGSDFDIELDLYDRET